MRLRSRILASVHETTEGLTAAGVMSKQTMREFDQLCLTPDAPVKRGRSSLNGEGRAGFRHSHCDIKSPQATELRQLAAEPAATSHAPPLDVKAELSSKVLVRVRPESLAVCRHPTEPPKIHQHQDRHCRGRVAAPQ
jgi:hypothetical protein